MSWTDDPLTAWAAGPPPAIPPRQPPGREIIARLEKIGDGDAMQAFRRLCAAARICSACCGSWDNPGCGCKCTSVPAGAP